MIVNEVLEWVGGDVVVLFVKLEFLKVEIKIVKEGEVWVKVDLKYCSLIL